MSAMGACTLVVQVCACLVCLFISVQCHFTSGYSSMNSAAPPGDVLVQHIYDPKVLGMEPCAATDAELEDFYKECMDPDLSFYRAKRPLTQADLRTYVENHIKDRLHIQSFVLIRDNKWYHPFHAELEHNQTSPEDAQGTITLWISATQWYMQKDVAEGKLDFPDTFFYLSDQDGGWCRGDGPGFQGCNIPALSFTKDTSRNRTDLLAPYMVGVDHPIYYYPWPLKQNKVFFRGRPNRGGSLKSFGNSSNLVSSRLHLANISALHSHILDIGLVEPHPQVANGTVAKSASIADHARYKYVAQLDGVTYSSRLSRLMHTNSVLLKEHSHWPEYFLRAMKEGVHYLTIFREHANDVLDVVKQWQGKERELWHLAHNSQQFAARHLCPIARMLYFRRLLREYNRLFHGEMQKFIEEDIWPMVQRRLKGEQVDIEKVPWA